MVESSRGLRLGSCTGVPSVLIGTAVTPVMRRGGSAAVLGRLILAVLISVGRAIQVSRAIAVPQVLGPPLLVMALIWPARVLRSLVRVQGAVVRH